MNVLLTVSAAAIKIVIVTVTVSSRIGVNDLHAYAILVILRAISAPLFPWCLSIAETVMEGAAVPSAYGRHFVTRVLSARGGNGLLFLFGFWQMAGRVALL